MSGFAKSKPKLESMGFQQQEEGTHEVVLLGEHVHGATLATANAGCLSEELSHHLKQWESTIRIFLVQHRRRQSTTKSVCSIEYQGTTRPSRMMEGTQRTELGCTPLLRA